MRTLLLTNCDTEVESPPAAMLPVIELARSGRFVEEWLKPWAADPQPGALRVRASGACVTRIARTPPTTHCTCISVRCSSQRGARQQLHRYAVALGRNALAGIRPRLRACRVATRIVWGADDTIFSAASAKYLVGSFGNSRGLRVLVGAKLFWPEERPELLAAQARILWESARV